MRWNRMFVIIGLLLLVWAWYSAGGIPQAANSDYHRLVKSMGASMSYTPGFDNVYKQMCTESRLLQNFYAGGAGLIFLAIGLTGERRHPASGWICEGGSRTSESRG